MNSIPGVTQDQIMGTIRQILMFGGGFAVGHHWVSPDTATMLTGIVLSCWPLIWTWWSNRRTGILSSAAALPEVTSIKTTRELAEATPSAKVTSDAK